MGQRSRASRIASKALARIRPTQKFMPIASSALPPVYLGLDHYSLANAVGQVDGNSPAHAPLLFDKVPDDAVCVFRISVRDIRPTGLWVRLLLQDIEGRFEFASLGGVEGSVGHDAGSSQAAVLLENSADLSVFLRIVLGQ